MISILYPSRLRALACSANIDKWRQMAVGDIEVILAIEADQIRNYSIGIKIDKLDTSSKGTAVDAINNAAKGAEGDILIVVSDDTDCFPGWDAFILKEVEGKTDWILKTQDGIQKYIITMPVMDRAYYNRFGYVYYPEYEHMFCDLELTCVADLTGRKLTSNLMFPHNHYSLGKAPKDQVSIKADATWNQGEKLFIERYHKSFDLKLKDIKGQITDRGMIDWITNKR